MTDTLLLTMRPVESHPRNDKPFLAFYDHSADPYVLDEATGHLTDYGAWADGGSHRLGKGFCVAIWQDQVYESNGEFSDGFWMPGAFFVWDDGDNEIVVNVTHWAELPEEPTA